MLFFFPFPPKIFYLLGLRAVTFSMLKTLMEFLNACTRSLLILITLWLTERLLEPLAKKNVFAIILALNLHCGLVVFSLTLRMFVMYSLEFMMF